MSLYIFRKKIISVALLTQACLLTNTALAEESVHWSYADRSGPNHWSELDERFTACKEGIIQSPINLNTKKLISDKEPIIFHYEAYKVKLKDYTFKISSKDSKHIEIAGNIYNLAQFHFHTPGEHSIDNLIYEGEMHFVHQDKDSNLAVVGIMIKEGKSNPLLKNILNTANKSKEEKFSIEDSNLMSLLPENKEYFHYMGSLTTPPCTEGVRWYVLKTPIEISKEELKLLKDSIPDNARPIQENNNRLVQ